MKTTRNMLTVAMVAIGLLAGTVRAATIMTATANGPNGSHDDWNLAANWTGGDTGIPTGAMDAVVSTGLYAEAWNVATPAYTGTLTLQDNATLQMGWTTNYPASVNALGGAGVTMNDNTAIRLRLPFTVTLPPLTLAGDGSIDLSPSTSAHHRTRDFDGVISGPGSLTVTGNNNNTANLNVANSFSGGFIGNASDSWRVDAEVAGALGIGDVTINGRSGVPARGVTLRINAEDTIADTATLFLNGGRDHRLAAKLILNADETVMGFFLDGVDLGTGMFDASSGLVTSNGDPLIGGNFTLFVTGPPAPEFVIPEPSTAALLGLAMLCLAACARRRNS